MTPTPFCQRCHTYHWSADPCFNHIEIDGEDLSEPKPIQEQPTPEDEQERKDAEKGEYKFEKDYHDGVDN